MNSEIPKNETDEQTGAPAANGSMAILTNGVADEAALHDEQIGPAIEEDRDGAHHIVGEFSLPRHPPIQELDSSPLTIREKTSPDNDNADDSEEEFLPVSIPNHSTGITTLGYQRVLKNRIRSGRLAKGGDYNVRTFTPTFVHDCLMLPGSLANVLGKGSAEQMIHRMTPAIVPGFRTHVHIDTEEPCLIQSEDPQAYAHGMLIFGEGKEGRERIHRHYRPHAKRIKVQVEMEMSVPIVSIVSEDGETLPQVRWVLEKKRLWAHAWLRSNVMDPGTQFRKDLDGWKLGEYLEGKYALNRALKKVKPGVREEYEAADSLDGEREWNCDGGTFDNQDWEPEPEPDLPSQGVGEEGGVELGGIGEE